MEGAKMYFKIETGAKHYTPDCKTMTVMELFETLEECIKDGYGELPVILSHDNGYAYGGLNPDLFEVTDDEESEF